MSIPHIRYKLVKLKKFILFNINKNIKIIKKKQTNQYNLIKKNKNNKNKKYFIIIKLYLLN